MAMILLWNSGRMGKEEKLYGCSVAGGLAGVSCGGAGESFFQEEMVEGLLTGIPLWASACLSRSKPSPTKCAADWKNRYILT